MAMFDILPTAFIFFAGAIIVALLPSGRISFKKGSIH
jgi:hypothetical protein